MKAKKIIAAILAATLAVSAFSACGAPAEKDSESSSTPSQSADGKIMDGDIEVSKPGEVPIVIGDKITLSVFTAPHLDKNSKFAYGENTFSTWLEDETNIHLDWNVVTNADKNAKLNLMFQGDDYEDIIFGSWWDGATQYSYAQQGYLLPLSDYYEDHAHYYNIWYDALIETGSSTENRMKTATMPDGKIYSWSLMNDAFNAQFAVRLWVYQPWLDALDIEMPTTTKEFEEMLIAFKNDDPNGNNQKDEIPLTGSVNDGWFADPTEHLMNSFVYYQKNEKAYVDDGEVVQVYTTDGYKEGLKWFSDLHAQGLLYTDTFTQANVDLRGLTTQDTQLVGVTAGGLQSNFTQMTNGEKGDWTNWTTIPPLKGPDGVQYARYVVAFPASRVNMTNNCEYPIAAFKLLDYLTKDDVGCSAVNGLEGEGWRRAEEGELGIDGQPAIYKTFTHGMDDGKTNYAWSQLAHYYTFPGWHQKQVIDNDPEADMETIIYNSALTYEPFKPDEDMILPPLIFDENDSKDFVTIKKGIFDAEKIFFANTIVDGYTDAKWDAWLAELETKQVDKLDELYQKGYQDYLARVG